MKPIHGDKINTIRSHRKESGLEENYQHLIHRTYNKVMLWTVCNNQCKYLPKFHPEMNPIMDNVRATDLLVEAKMVPEKV